MYIDVVPNRNSPPAILLREARRQGKIIVKVTLANLSHLSPQRIDILRRALDENSFYRALSWLAQEQAAIEHKLFRHRYPSQSALEHFLYDVTSSYLEKTENELAEYSYDRDKLKG